VVPYECVPEGTSLRPYGGPSPFRGTEACSAAQGASKCSGSGRRHKKEALRRGEAGPHLRSASGSKAGSSEEPACPSKCLRTEAAREVLAPLLSASPTLPVACSASLSHDPPEKVRRALLDKNRSASEEHHAPPRRGAAPVALNPSPEGKGRPHFSEGVVSRPTPSPFGESGRGGSGSGDLLISQQKSLN
jgi:hypothetical protein